MVESKYITSLGIELEGGISKEGVPKLAAYVSKNRLLDRFQFGTDGTATAPKAWQAGLEFRCWDTMDNKLNKLFSLIEYMFNECDYSQGIGCGTHIHMRYADLDMAVAIIGTETFNEKFIADYTHDFKDVNKYINRLNNNYCKPTYVEDNVLDALNYAFSYKERRINPDNPGRYAAINLRSLNEEQKTVEYRIMPHMDNAKEMISATEWLCKEVEGLFDDILNGKLKCGYQTGDIKLIMPIKRNNVQMTISSAKKEDE